MASSLRRLPVLQNSSPEDAEAESRRPWQWVLLGAVLIFVLWLPVAVVALWIGSALSSRRLGATDPASVDRFLATADSADRVLMAASMLVPVLASFLLAAVLGGAVVARFGGRARSRHAAWAGAGAGLLAATLAAIGGALSPWPVALASVLALSLSGLIGGALGGRWGMARRPRV